jgi:hypothetical protein
MKLLAEIWSRLPRVQFVARFMDRRTANAWTSRTIQPQTKPDRATKRRRFFAMLLTSRGEFLAGALLIVLLVTALPGLAQVPGDFVKITSLELSTGTPTLEYENVSQKPVTAFASSGVETACKCFLERCRYSEVVARSSCPRSTGKVFNSMPASS